MRNSRNNATHTRQYVISMGAITIDEREYRKTHAILIERINCAKTIARRSLRHSLVGSRALSADMLAIRTVTRIFHGRVESLVSSNASRRAPLMASRCSGWHTGRSLGIGEGNLPTNLPVRPTGRDATSRLWITKDVPIAAAQGNYGYRYVKTIARRSNSIEFDIPDTDLHLK